MSGFETATVIPELLRGGLMAQSGVLSLLGIGKTLSSSLEMIAALYHVVDEVCTEEEARQDLLTCTAEGCASPAMEPLFEIMM